MGWPEKPRTGTLVHFWWRRVFPISSPPSSSDVIDLPRICAVHDMPYIARYVRGADDWLHHAQTIQVTRHLYRTQYEAAEGVIVDAADLDEEACAWCGARGFGSLSCGKCKAEICYGRVTIEGFVRCRDSCGLARWMGKAVVRPHEGVRPRLR